MSIQEIACPDIGDFKDVLVIDVLVSQAREQGASLVLVTHSESAAARADRVMVLTNEGLGSSPR